jgi:hypothetical protein
MEQAEHGDGGGDDEDGEVFMPGASKGGAKKDGSGSSKPKGRRKRAGGDGDEEGDEDDDTGSGKKGENEQVPYRCIIQARKEMPLVQLCLRRHRRGEKKTDYVTYKDAEGEKPVRKVVKARIHLWSGHKMRDGAKSFLGGVF